MRFYTNVQLVGDHVLVRGYENGRNFMTREKFYPTLFVPSKNKTKYKTLEGNYVETIQPGTVRECRDFIKKYDGVENFKIYVILDTSISIFLKSIQRMKLSLILPRLKSPRLILKLSLKMDFLMLSRQQKKFF